MYNPKFVTVKKTEVSMFDLEGNLDEVISKLQMIRNIHGSNLSLKINETTVLKIDVNGLHLETKEEMQERIEKEKKLKQIEQQGRILTLANTLSN